MGSHKGPFCEQADDDNAAGWSPVGRETLIDATPLWRCDKGICPHLLVSFITGSTFGQLIKSLKAFKAALVCVVEEKGER